jgi:hypothetical protein
MHLPVNECGCPVGVPEKVASRFKTPTSSFRQIFFAFRQPYMGEGDPHQSREDMEITLSHFTVI